MEVKKINVLESSISSCKKLRDSIYNNDFINEATPKQEQACYKMLESLILKTKDFLDENKNHSVVKTLDTYIERIKQIVENEDITYDLDNMMRKLQLFYDFETSSEESRFIAAADAVILWPLRFINEVIYREITGKVFDIRFNVVFEEIKKI